MLARIAHVPCKRGGRGTDNGGGVAITLDVLGPSRQMTTHPSRDSAHRTRLWWLPYAYLLRVQLLAGLFLVAFPFYGQRSPLLAGLFDLDASSLARSVLGMALVSLAALSTAMTLMTTTWVTVSNAPDRFGTPPVASVSFPVPHVQRTAFAALAAPTIIVTIVHSYRESGVSPWVLASGTVLGGLLCGATLAWTRQTASWLAADAERPSPRTFVGKSVRLMAAGLVRHPGLHDGFLDAGTNRFRPGHLLAWTAFLQTAGLYAAIGLSKYARLGEPTYVSTLACLLLMLLVLCWLSAGLAFFFDRYRVPVLIPLLTLPLATAWLPTADHVFHTSSGPTGYSPTPGYLLNQRTDPAIVIAANGGGIQAAAWTARVLAGLDLALRPEFGDGYASAIRLISAVSGGGVGAMHFVDKFRDGRLAANARSAVVEQSDQSSLDEVAWGTAYPDLLRAFVPLPFRWATLDRGQALEWAWAGHDPLTRDTLATWRDDVWLGRRPAMLFNATLVDTGERLLMGTTRVGWSEHAGLQNFEDQHQRDIGITTAARLSASFTYVSPAARTDGAEPGYHIVDGGYSDNFGMATAMAWIHQGLEESGLVRHLLLLQIRGAPSPARAAPSGHHGWLYQAWAPLQTLLAVRETAQIAHNDDQLALLRGYWCQRGVRIDTATFEFSGDGTPLSWHLTGRERRRLDDEWGRHVTGPAVEEVRRFLAVEALRTSNPAAYDAAIRCKSQ